jgi:hypothetical protein
MNSKRGEKNLEIKEESTKKKKHAALSPSSTPFPAIPE